MIALGLLAAPAPVLPTAAARAETGVTATTITIGIQATVTGAAPYPQNAFDIGKDVYWKYIAAKGGIFGRNVQVLVRDDRFDTQTALNVCGDLVDVQKVFILLELRKVLVLVELVLVEVLRLRLFLVELLVELDVVAYDVLVSHL